jgi:hypothetical protein
LGLGNVWGPSDLGVGVVCDHQEKRMERVDEKKKSQLGTSTS